MANIPKTRQREDYRSFYLKKSTWDAIRISHGWTGKGAISRFAETVGITRQYAAGIVANRCGCSSNVMRKIIRIFGLDQPCNGKHQCWCHLFDTVVISDIDPNHPIFNQMKYSGEAPYSMYSEAANLRGNDYVTEKREFSKIV